MITKIIFKIIHFPEHKCLVALFYIFSHLFNVWQYKSWILISVSISSICSITYYIASEDFAKFPWEIQNKKGRYYLSIIMNFFFSHLGPLNCRRVPTENCRNNILAESRYLHNTFERINMHRRCNLP